MSEFERNLVAACALGEACEPNEWDGNRPENSSISNEIRAELIRFLVLGGDQFNPVHEQGVMLQGAWVVGELDLCHTNLPVRLALQNCYVENDIFMMAAVIPELALVGSRIKGLGADRLTVKGGAFLRGGFLATNLVNLSGSRIRGNLEFDDAELLSSEPRALNLEGANIDGGLLLRNIKAKGRFALSSCKIDTLLDDYYCCTEVSYILDGFEYRRIVGPTDYSARIAWLHKQLDDHLNDDFKPQPWEQLIKVLREMGHAHDATEIAVAKQRALRKAGKIGGGLRGGMHWLYGALVDFGYRPMKLVGWMAGFWLTAAFFFSIGGQYGYVGPSTPLLNSPELAAEIDRQCGFRDEQGKQPWARCPAMPAEYTTFQPLLYSLDLILPLVDLQQEIDWAPIVESSPSVNLPFGAFLRWLMWAEILFGWLASLMLVAILGRLVERD